MSDDGLIDLIRREAATAAAMRHWTGTVVVTSYDPKRHSIKGILVPHEIETGDIPIGAGGIGNGYGDLIGPKVGSAEALDGDQFSVQFDAGNTNTLIATHRIFSDQDVPPQVQSGEMLRQHSTGTKVFFDKDGQATVEHGPSQNTIVFGTDTSITTTHKPSGSNFQIDKDGNHIHDAKGKSVTFKNTGAGVMIDNLTVSGNSTLNTGTIGAIPIAHI